MSYEDCKKDKLIKNTFIKYEQKRFCNGSFKSASLLPTNMELKIKISVVPHLITASKTGLGLPTSKGQEFSVVTDLKAMYASEDNLSDLKLEMKDSITLSAHKFILCARSEV